MLDSTTAIYVLCSLIVSTLLLSIIKICMNRRQEAAKAETSSIEAFAYDETSPAAKKQVEEDTENSSQVGYHNLADGNRPTTPAVF